MSTCSSCPRSARIWPSSGSQPELQVLVLAQGTAQHLLHLEDHGVDVDHLRLQILLPGKGQELAGDVGRPGGRPDHLFHVAAAGIVLVEAPDDEFTEPDHASHHVVHFVSHASGELTGRLHPLGPPEMLLDFLPLGDIAVDPANNRGLPVLEGAAQVALDGDRRSGFGHEHQLDVVQALAREHPLDDAGCSAAGCRGEECQKAAGSRSRPAP